MQADVWEMMMMKDFDDNDAVVAAEFVNHVQ